MEYLVIDIVKKLGELVNKAQKIRNGIPVEMKRGDARHVCLSGIQTTIAPLMLSFGALECSNQNIKNIELSKVCGIKNRTNKEILDEFDTWAKLNLLVFTHFKIENLFLNLLKAIDTRYNKRRFFEITRDLFSRVTITNKPEKENCFIAISIMRNSLHNNSINRNCNFNELINGRRFTFVKNKPTTGTIFDHIFLIDFALDIIEEIIKSPEILKLSSPIPDLFHVEIGYR